MHYLTRNFNQGKILVIKIFSFISVAREENFTAANVRNFNSHSMSCLINSRAHYGLTPPIMYNFSLFLSLFYNLFFRSFFVLKSTTKDYRPGSFVIQLVSVVIVLNGRFQKNVITIRDQFSLLSLYIRFCFVSFFFCQFPPHSYTFHFTHRHQHHHRW